VRKLTINIKEQHKITKGWEGYWRGRRNFVLGLCCDQHWCGRGKCEGIGLEGRCNFYWTLSGTEC